MKHFYRWPFLTVMTLALLLVGQTAGPAPKGRSLATLGEEERQPQGQA
jgi:hypothetical protein